MLENAYVYALQTISAVQWVEPAEIHRHITVAIQNQLVYAGSAAQPIHYFGAVPMLPQAKTHGKATTHGAGATVKPQPIFKTAMQKENIGFREVPTLPNAVQDHAAYAVRPTTIVVVCAPKAVNRDGSCVLTVTETTSIAGVT